MEEVSKQVYRVEEVAVIMDMSTATIYRLLESGELDGVKLGGNWRIPKKVIDNLLTPSKDN